MRSLQCSLSAFLIFSCAILLPVRAQQNRTSVSTQTVEHLSGPAPELVGFSTDRLRRLKSALEQSVQDKQFAGMVYMLARHGKLVQIDACGKKDLAAGAPMTRDTIFRIFSMTKPITAVAMMMLYEEGKWNPDDPIAKYIPEFKSLKVFRGVDPNGGALVEDPGHAPRWAN